MTIFNNSSRRTTASRHCTSCRCPELARVVHKLSQRGGHFIRCDQDLDIQKHDVRCSSKWVDVTCPACKKTKRKPGLRARWVETRDALWRKECLINHQAEEYLKKE